MDLSLAPPMPMFSSLTEIFCSILTSPLRSSQMENHKARVPGPFRCTHHFSIILPCSHAAEALIP